MTDLIGEKRRKNRPGQRTRRKQVLEKYGRNAEVAPARRPHGARVPRAPLASCAGRDT